MTRDVKWEDWKNTDPTETLKMFRKAEKEDLVPGIEEDVITTSKPEEKMHVNVIPDDGERVRPNEISENSSDIMYLKKYADSEMSVYNRVLNALKQLDTFYNLEMQNMQDPVIEGNYKVTVDTRVIKIVKHEDDEIYWACITSIYTDDGEPETLKEAMTSTNGNLWKMSSISEVNNFLSRKAWISTKRSAVKYKGRKPVTGKWVFKIKEEADGLISLKYRNLAKGYMQVMEVDFTE